MGISQVIESFSDLVNEHGWRFSIVPVERLPDLREAIHGRYEKGLFNELFIICSQTSFHTLFRKIFPKLVTYIILAVPTPQMRDAFNWKGKPVPLIFPPAYVGYAPRTEKIQVFVQSWLNKKNFKLAKPKL